MRSASNELEGSSFYGKFSIILPFVGLATSILLFCFLIFTANDPEGRLWGEVIGIILGGAIVIILTIIGFCFSLISLHKERCPWFTWTGLILNLCLLAFSACYLRRVLNF